MSEIAISLPFRFGTEAGVPGALNTTTDIRYIWRDRVYVAVLTGLKERIMRPDYGTYSLRALFETSDVAAQTLSETISGSFYKWLPKLGLLSVDTSYDTTVDLLYITINYVLPDSTQDQLSFSTSVLDRYGEIIEEVK